MSHAASPASNFAENHPVNGVPYKLAAPACQGEYQQQEYQMLVEIPAGTLEKWQTDPVSGEFYHDRKNGKPRVIDFLPYPMNYGFIPQTLLPKDAGGDGDPLDIVLLSKAYPRGSVLPVRVIGALKLSERGEEDTKIVALLPEGPFADIDDLPELLTLYPGALEIVRLWFEGYKGPGSFLFKGYARRDEAMQMIEEHHRHWKAIM